MSAGKIQDGAVGTGKLGDASVTVGKLASNSVTGTSIAPNSIGAGQILDGQVVEGDGRLQQIETTVLDGVNDGPVLNFPGIGALRADCVAGNTTTEFVNNSGTNIQVIKWGVINAGTDQAAIDSANPGNGAVISQPSGIGGISGITWLVSFKDTAGLHLVKIEVVTHQVIMDCVVAAQAVHTG